MKAIMLVLVGSEIALTVALFLAARAWIRLRDENGQLFRTNSDLRCYVDREEDNIRKLRETIDELRKIQERQEIEKREAPPAGDSAARLDLLNRVQDSKD